MPVDAFVGLADDPLRSAWLRSADQILPRLRDNGREAGSKAWESALFGTILIEGDWTEDDDVIAGDINQVVAITGAWTEDDDVMAGVLNSLTEMIPVGTIDAVPLVGPTLEEGEISDEFTVATIDGSAPVVGPLFVANLADPIYSTPVTIHLFDIDGETLIDTLSKADDVTWLDEADGTGSGSFVLPRSETATADLCIPGRLVRCYLYGLDVFTWKIDGPPEDDELKREEESVEVLRFEGTGWGGLLDDVRVEPAIPVLEAEPDLSTPFGGRDRVFSFGSPDFPNDWWPHAMEHYEYSELQPFRFQTVETLENIFDDLPSPVNMPYPNSDLYLFGGSERVYWIWPGENFFEEGFGFFRGILIDPPVGAIFTISCSADNLFTLYVDGVPFLAEHADTLMWTGFKEVSVTIQKSRWYMFGAAVQNTSGIPGGWNPGGWLMASYFAGNQGEPAGAALLSNANWTATFSAGAWPGWTAGQIVHRLLAEATLPHRNAVNGALAATFSDFSGSDGRPWTVLIDGYQTDFIPTFTVRIGSTVLEALIQLADEGWVHWHVRPGSTLLDMWSYDSPSRVSGVQCVVSTDTVKGNLMDIERAPDALFANDLLVAYDDGVTKYVRVRDDASVAARGSHEEVWDSGGTSAEEATRLGKVELRKRATNNEGGAIVAVVEPRTVGELPYYGYNVLDSVEFPSKHGGTFDAIVYSIGVSTDPEGNPIFTLELNKRWPTPERDQSRLLRSIGGKTVGSWKGRL